MTRTLSETAPQEKSAAVSLAAGFCGLAIAMGVGRFLYTSLLPGMMAAYGFGEAVAGAMASWNYVGYLAGALAMTRVSTSGRYPLFIFWTLLSLVTTAGMGLVKGELAWHTVRFFSGLASAGMFVLVSALVLDALARAQRASLAGFLYSGVGTGIAASGLAGPFLAARFGPDGAWLGMGLACLPFALFSFWALKPPAASRHAAPARAAAPAASALSGRSDKKAWNALFVAYFLEGLGYIISATFLVAQVGAATGSQALADASWVITGGAAACTAPLWPFLARRTGYLKALLAALLLQSLGVALPALSSAAWAALAGGLLFGGTFMGIVVLSLQYGVTLSGRSSAWSVGILTAIYGVGQIIAPVVAGKLAENGAGLGISFTLSSAGLLLAVVVLVLGHMGKKTG